MKKAVPLSVRQMIDSFTKEYPNLFVVKLNKSSILTLIDADPESDFYFEVYDIFEASKKKKEPKGYEASIYYKPFSSENLDSFEENVKVEDLKAHLQVWISYLIEYSEPSITFDDTFSKEYEAEYAKHFQLLDPDADTKPYSIEKQKQIVGILNDTVEIDETVIGGFDQDSPGRSHGDKKIVAVALQVDYPDDDLLKPTIKRGSAQVIRDFSGKELRAAIEQMLQPQAIVTTDQWPAYTKAVGKRPHLALPSEKGANFPELHW